MNHKNKLKHECVDKDEADDHPDIQIGDVAHLRHGAPHPAEHGRQGQDGRHGYGDPSRYGVGWYVQRQVTCIQVYFNLWNRKDELSKVLPRKTNKDDGRNVCRR